MPIIVAAIQPCLSGYGIGNLMEAVMVIQGMANEHPGIAGAISVIQDAAMSGNLPSSDVLEELKGNLA